MRPPALRGASSIVGVTESDRIFFGGMTVEGLGANQPLRRADTARTAAAATIPAPMIVQVSSPVMKLPSIRPIP